MAEIEKTPEIQNKYEVLGKLGEGGMGAVYKVRHRFLDELRVIKTIRPQLANDPELQARFRREAQVASQLDHPRIARLYDYSVDEKGGAFIVMEYVEGTNLAEYVKGLGGVLTPSETVEIGRQALEALAFLHRNHFVHRDVSIENLMVTTGEYGQPMVTLIDLGLVRSFEAMDYRTKTGMVMGKMHYLSPEQLDSSRRRNMAVDARSDLYALGILLFVLLTGEYPIVGDDPPSIITGHLLHPPRSFTAVAPRTDIPPALQQVVLKALEKDPEDRWQSAEEMSRALVASVLGTPTGPAPAPVPEASEEPTLPIDASRRAAGLPAWARLAALAAGGAVVVLAVLLLSRFRDIPSGPPDLRGNLELAEPVATAEPPAAEADPEAEGPLEEADLEEEGPLEEAPLVPASELVDPEPEAPFAPPPPAPAPPPPAAAASEVTPEPVREPEPAAPTGAAPSPAAAEPAPSPPPPATPRQIVRALVTGAKRLAEDFEDHIDRPGHSETDAEEDLEDLFDDLASEAEDLADIVANLAGDLGPRRRRRAIRNVGESLEEMQKLGREVEALLPVSPLPPPLAAQWSTLKAQIRRLEQARPRS